jgi:hypothetical protein
VKPAHTGLAGQLVQRDALADMFVDVAADSAKRASCQTATKPVHVPLTLR